MRGTEARNRALWNALPRDVKSRIEDAVYNGKMEVNIELPQLGYSESQREEAIETITKLNELIMLAPFEQYLVDCIEQGHEDKSDLVVYSLGEVGAKVKWAYDRFIEEYGWRIPHVGREQAMTEWLQGLCPSVRLVFTNHDVTQLRKEWSVSEREYDWVCGWFALCAKTLLDLHQRYCITTTWYKQRVNMTGTPIGVDSVREWIKNNPAVSELLRHTYFGWVGTEYKVIVSVQSYGKTDYMPDEDYINGVTYNITQHN